MGCETAIRRAGHEDLFADIGAFLREQGLSPAPEHYAFAHRVLTEPDGAVAAAVARLTAGQVRLSRHDIEALGGTAVAGPATPAFPAARDAQADRLVAETRAQVASFAELTRTIYDETRGFGRDLAASAADAAARPLSDPELVRIARAMIARVASAESRLAAATEEADGLRAKLAEAQDSARRDPLTGLPNRRAFEEVFAARDEAAGPWCVAMCDIDRFKRINDGFGHALGDRVLSAIGRMLADACEGHAVARHGGEEFAILIGGMPLAEAAALLDAGREAVGGKRFRSRESDAPLGRVTFSGGVTEVRAGEGVAAAVARADRLLYAAKAAGRDRLCVE